MPASLTRTVRFFALHRMARPDWTDAQNAEAFGALAERPGHGHDYECAVTVTGPLDRWGMVVDLALLDRLLAEEVTAPLAGGHLNVAVAAFAEGRALPTSEALAAHLYDRISARLPSGVTLVRVRIAEDPLLHADYTAP